MDAASKNHSLARPKTCQLIKNFNVVVEIAKALLIETKPSGFPGEGIENMDAFFEQVCTRHP